MVTHDEGGLEGGREEKAMVAQMQNCSGKKRRRSDRTHVAFFRTAADSSATRAGAASFGRELIAHKVEGTTIGSAVTPPTYV